MKKLIIHIGLHKTGTTSLQNFLFSNKTILENSNILYPETPQNDITPFQHRFLIKLLNNNPNHLLNYFNKFSIENKTIIISSECFLENETYPELLGQLSNIFDDIKVIIYLRRQDDWIESLYKEIVKYNQKISLTTDDFINSMLNGGFQHFSGNYFNIIKNWASIFGHDNIIIRSFDKKSFFNRNLIDDFFHALKLNFQISKLNHYEMKNIGLTNRNEIEIYRYTNNKINLTQQIRLINHMNPLRQDNFRLISPDSSQKILSKFQNSNQLIEASYLNGKKLFNTTISPVEWKKYTGLNKQEKQFINHFINNDK